MKFLLSPVAGIGATVLGMLAWLGELALFALSGLSHIWRPPFYPRLVGRAFMEIGFYSLPVVALTALFTGMVLALQSYTGFSRFSARRARSPAWWCSRSPASWGRCWPG